MRVHNVSWDFSTQDIFAFAKLKLGFSLELFLTSDSLVPAVAAALT